MQLAELGRRICILGPSNSGKSTLAAAIARKRDLPAIHLDQFYHRPDTDWQPRPTAEFVALHDAAIVGDRWVMDGNYSQCMPQRLRRATGVILLDISVPASLLRYFRRTLFERGRIGALEGGQDSIKWLMIRHISVVSPKNQKRYADLFQKLELPKIYLRSTREVGRFYEAWNLER